MHKGFQGDGYQADLSKYQFFFFAQVIAIHRESRNHFGTK